MKKLFFLLILVLLVAGGLIYYKKWRKEFLLEKVPQFVFLKSDSLYRITYDTIDIDEVEGEIVIRNLQLIPDSTYKKPTDSTLPRNLLRVKVAELHVTGVQTDAAVLNKEVIATKIKLTRPVVTMYNNRRGAKNNDTTPTTDKIYQVLLRGLQKIKVDTIILADADYHICRWPKGDTVFSGLKINAQLHHIDISDSTSTDSTRILFAQSASLDVNKLLLRRSNQLYHYQFTDLTLQSKDRSFAIKKAQITPLLGEAAFLRAAKWQTDRFDVDLHNLLFKNIDVRELLNGNLIADELSVSKTSFKIARDRSYPLRTVSKVGHYPQQELLKIPIDLALKKVIVQDGYIEYKEKVPKTGSSGVLVFDNVYATLHNVTSRRKDIRKNNVFTIHFNSRLLSSIPLTATLKLYYGNNKGRFAVNGSLKSTDATIFNRLSKPMAMVEINSGNINSLDFNLIGNDYNARGIVRLLYNDLKIKILKKDQEEKEIKNRKMVTLLANMAILDANPGKKNDVERIVSISHPRDVSASIFNLIWKSIFKGVQNTLGITGGLPL
ncbi:hypothetical protein [Longitalea luteola]|uniref:hypothetical protein n=1 Tax=Longitalea luteola TaxID=2812563 RepID=UPI001A963B6A|nr:hypothetical protein [Longitalea luteola]